MFYLHYFHITLPSKKLARNNLAIVDLALLLRYRLYQNETRSYPPCSLLNDLHILT